MHVVFSDDCTSFFKSALTSRGSPEPEPDDWSRRSLSDSSSGMNASPSEPNLDLEVLNLSRENYVYSISNHCLRLVNILFKMMGGTIVKMYITITTVTLEWILMQKHMEMAAFNIYIQQQL